MTSNGIPAKARAPDAGCGAPLSYVPQEREEAMRELKRVAGRHAGDRRKQALGRCATGSES